MAPPSTSPGRTAPTRAPMAAAIRMAAHCAAAPGTGGVTPHAGAAARGHRPPRAQASKALGQNFILDRQLLARIAAIPGPLDGQTVYEVGPGPGGLTRALLEPGARRRGRARPPLPARPGRAAKQLIRAAAGDRGRRAQDRRARARSATAPMSSPTCPTMSAPRCCCAGSSGPWPPWWRSLTLMFQREVAERIVAAPGSERLRPAGGRSPSGAPTPRIAHERPPLGLRAAAQGDVGGGPHRPASRCPRASTRPCSNGSPRPPSASAARCCARASRACRARSMRWKGSESIAERRAETLSVDEFVQLPASLAPRVRLVLLRRYRRPWPKPQSARA